MFRQSPRTTSNSEGSWLIRILPGLWVTGFVIAARLIGALQPLELLALDYFLRLRPPEPPDDRIVIVEIDAEAVERMGGYPIDPRKLAEMVRSLQQHDPAVIGVNILSDLLAEEHYDDLSQLFQEHDNLIAAEKVLPIQIGSFPDIPKQQVGFTDIYVDDDDRLRRMLLGTLDPVKPEEFKFSFAIRLAEVYLEPRGYVLDNGFRDPEAMRFGQVEIPRITPNTGGYVQVNAGGVQTLLNFRSGRNPFKILAAKDIMASRSNQMLKGQVVILGVVDESVRPYLQTNAVDKSQTGEVSGLQIQAHTVSQIISSALDGRSNLKSLPEVIEYLWILAWGILFSIIWVLNRTMHGLIIQVLGSTCLVFIVYCSLIRGYTIPVIPTLLIAPLNFAQISIYEYTYKRQRKLTSKITEHQEVIERTFAVIHNGPLQDLANILRDLYENNFTKEKLVDELNSLNARIREIGDNLKAEAGSSNKQFCWIGSIMLDLRQPVHELFYQVYSKTTSRQLAGFRNLKGKIRSFDPIDERYLTVEQKRRLCLFLEEALCNAGKHGGKVTLLKAIGVCYDTHYVLQVDDNGLGIHSDREGEGTRLAKKLARDLGGNFNRLPIEPKGSRCELSWKLKPRSFQLKFLRRSIKIKVNQWLSKILKKFL